MVSSNQTDTVKRLEAEGWVIVPAPDKLVLGGPVVMERPIPSVGVDRIAVIPNGEVLSHG